MPASIENGFEVIPLISNEELLQKRIELHHELGTLSAQLSDINVRYHDCIQAMILTNDELRRRGLDTTELEQQTTYSHPAEEDDQPALLPTAINL